ncbi:hypothetical protein HY025_00345 [Candidatus Daviesbacteria bacterium]|nr:hypothetical protein [Candidatus Daviesbacteria bacterium]
MFEPVIIYMTVLGLTKLLNSKNFNSRLILRICLFLVGIQLVVGLFDINQREFIRHERSSNSASNIVIDKQ